jgi:NAD(P)-dependent dehydrogenase (short-subunit alcohol dehydrogenase family)
LSDISLDEINKIELPENLTNLYSLEGYCSIVTGGGSGLGEAIALGLATFGSNIILLDKNKQGLQRVQKRIIEEIGSKCEIYPLDITSWEQINETSKIIRNKHKKVDVLVNSAGMNIRKEVLDLTPQEFQQVIQVDLVGTFLCCKAFGEIMVGNKEGSIINIASINAHIALEKNSAYGAAKGGVVQLTKVLAAEWSKHNVRVNALSPAHHKTPLVTQLVNDKQWYDSLIKKIPMGRFAEAYEIIGPAVFLASKASSFTTGVSMLTDGGWTIL